MKTAEFTRRLLREPLAHFLVLGAALFLVFGLTPETEEQDTRRIVVNAGQVEQLAAQFERTWLRPPTPAELDGLVESFVRKEIFYREAQALGLAEDDPYVRNRLALKLEIVLEDFSTAPVPTDEELARYFEQEAERFAEPGRLSFQHVYLNPDRHPDTAAEAARVLGLLQEGADPGRLGDLSMVASRFDGADHNEISRNFGDAFAEAVAALEPGVWAGPILSPFGLHLVRVSEHEPARYPPLADVRDAVLAEWQEQRRRESREQAYQRLRERYEVIVAPEAAPGAGAERP